MEGKVLEFLAKIFDSDKLRSLWFLVPVTVGCVICMRFFAKTSTEKCCFAFAITYFGAHIIDAMHRAYKDKKARKELQKEERKNVKKEIYQYYDPYLNENNIMYDIIRELVKNHNKEITCEENAIRYLYDSDNVIILKGNKGTIDNMEGVFVARQSEKAGPWLIKLTSEDYQRLAEYFKMP